MCSNVLLCYVMCCNVMSCIIMLLFCYVVSYNVMLSFIMFCFLSSSSLFFSLSFLLLLSRLSPLPYSAAITYAYALPLPTITHLLPTLLLLLSLPSIPPPSAPYCLHTDHYRKTEQHQPERDHHRFLR
jgi:hypothetical protein